MGRSILVIVATAAVCAFAVLACQEAADTGPTSTPVSPTLVPVVRTQTAEANQLRWATRTANATSSAEERKRTNSSTTRSTTPRESVDRNLIIDIDNIGYAADALMPHLRRCIQRGDLNWNNHSGFFDELAKRMEAIARDVQDGYLDDYSKDEVRSMVSSAMNRFDQLERQCLR